MIWSQSFYNYLKNNMISENAVTLDSNPNHGIFFMREYRKSTKEQVTSRSKSYKAN